MSDGLVKSIITIGEVVIDNAQVEKVLGYTAAAVAAAAVVTGAYVAHKVVTVDILLAVNGEDSYGG